MGEQPKSRPGGGSGPRRWWEVDWSPLEAAVTSIRERGEAEPGRWAPAFRRSVTSRHFRSPARRRGHLWAALRRAVRDPWYLAVLVALTGFVLASVPRLQRQFRSAAPGVDRERSPAAPAGSPRDSQARAALAAGDFEGAASGFARGLATRSPDEVLVELRFVCSQESLRFLVGRLSGEQFVVLPVTGTPRACFRVYLGPYLRPEQAQAALRGLPTAVAGPGFRPRFVEVAELRLPQDTE